jgi:hypothetical protein
MLRWFNREDAIYIIATAYIIAVGGWAVYVLARYFVGYRGHSMSEPFERDPVLTVILLLVYSTLASVACVLAVQWLW